jgi:hypothetical protein
MCGIAVHRFPCSGPVTRRPEWASPFNDTLKTLGYWPLNPASTNTRARYSGTHSDPRVLFVLVTLELYMRPLLVWVI